MPKSQLESHHSNQLHAGVAGNARQCTKHDVDIGDQQLR